MNSIILYGTCYGSSKQYADELSRRTGLPCESYENADDLSGYEKIIYIGSLYAGGVLGMAELLRGTGLNPQQRRFTDTIRHSGQALLAIINDCLTACSGVSDVCYYLHLHQ